jgi:hypothetical protein
MKIEDPVVSWKLAREMKKLGAEQDGMWIWLRSPHTNSFEVILRETAGLLEDLGWQLICSAPTVAELGKMLPKGYRSYYYNGHPSGGTWMCNDGEILGVVDANKEADARAKMMISLIKAGLIKEEEVEK